MHITRSILSTHIVDSECRHAYSAFRRLNQFCEQAVYQDCACSYADESRFSHCCALSDRCCSFSKRWSWDIAKGGAAKVQKISPKPLTNTYFLNITPWSISELLLSPPSLCRPCRCFGPSIAFIIRIIITFIVTTTTTISIVSIIDAPAPCRCFGPSTFFSLGGGAS